jgi:hypothetical protein
LIADASNKEIDRLNARAQHLRSERGELGAREIYLTDTHYPIREGDHVAFIAQHRPPRQPRVENGTRAEVTRIGRNGTVTLTLDGSEREITLEGKDTDSLRLAYAQHVYRQQGATVERSVVLTGGWQPARSQPTSKPPAPAMAPTGTSHATNSAKKDKTPTGSRASPNA